MLLTPAQLRKIVGIKTKLFFATRGGRPPCVRACFDIALLSQSYYYLNLSELSNSVGGQLHGDKECPFRDVTTSGRVWRKVPESEAWGVMADVTGIKPRPHGIKQHGQSNQPAVNPCILFHRQDRRSL